MKKSKKKYVYSGKEELDNSSKFLRNYNSGIVKIFLNHFKSKGSKILDFGAGIGTLSILYEKMSGVKPFCVEIDLENRKSLKSKGFIVFKSIFDSKNNFDAVFSSNVLEHIEKDEEEINNSLKILNKNGMLIILVPAHQKLFSKFDKEIGHFRRYDLDFFKNLHLQDAKIEKLYYLDSAGYFLYYLNKLFFKNESYPSAFKIFVWDKFFTPISLFLDYLTNYKFGKNVLCVIKKIN